MEKIGIFGGTFNPVHKGHEIAALRFYDRFKLDKLLIVPANIPPHKQIAGQVTARQRFEMCELGFNKKNMSVLDLEIKKDSVSYSFDTVAEIKKNYKNGKLYFLVGSDMLLYLENWYKYQELLKLCAFVVAYRNGQDRDGILELRDKLIKMGAEIELLENEPFEISSTELREHIKNNNIELDKYISRKVLEYIKEKKVYEK